MRGRSADQPSDIPAKGWKDILWRVKEEIDADQVGLVAAGIAFYGLLALFPLITALVALAGVISEPDMIAQQTEALAGAIPEQVANIVLGQINEVASASEGALGIAAVFGILVAIYSASKGVDNLIRGLNIAYNEEEERGFFALKMTVLLLTLGLIIGILLALGIAAVLPTVLGFLGDGFVTTVVVWVRWPLLALIGAAGITALYRYGPSRDPAKFRWITPGAILACTLWIAASVGFAWYVDNFGSYNETFGTLGGVIVLLTWLWMSAFIVLMGAELDSEMEAQTRRDTTVGAPKPMGHRDATKADRLGQPAE